MSPIEMVDHLTRALRMSLRDDAREIRATPEQIAGYLSFLRSDKPLPRNLRSPEEFYEIPLPEGNFDESRIRLLRTLIDMQLLFTKNPGFSSIHPDFGRLDVELWTLLHMKHCTHHFSQFGLMESMPSELSDREGKNPLSKFL
jgi:oxepin-CoA hydrolase/3-oxo-5,6-dehydrosuberyl-CoA semialdehyde dehydrogenase